jgi:hypothetical protein
MNDLEWYERAALIGSVFLFFFGVGLIIDGKRLLTSQYEASSRVDYSSTLNLF